MMITGQTEHPNPALQTAHTTLLNGCRFLIARSLSDVRPQPVPAKVGLRMAGNHLKELDRFLAILVAECEAPADAGHQRLMNAHRPRLRAVQRVRIAACHGPADLPDHLAAQGRLRKDLALASSGASSAPAGHAHPALNLSDHVLAEIARFYITLADQLHALWIQSHPRAHALASARAQARPSAR